MIIGLAFLTIQHMDFTPPPQSFSDEELNEQTEVEQPEIQSENGQQRDITILESHPEQTVARSEINTVNGNSTQPEITRDSLYLSQFGAQ
jgi:hypothetical protein